MMVLLRLLQKRKAPWTRTQKLRSAEWQWVFLQLVTNQQHLVSTVLGRELNYETWLGARGEDGGGAGAGGRSEQGEHHLGWG